MGKPKNKTDNLIDKVFDVIAQSGGRKQKDQITYALKLGQFLESHDKIAAYEAETGIGKCIGYLVPCLLFLANQGNDKRIVVSTFTRALQRQIMDKDLPIIENAFDVLGIPMPSVAIRMGKQSFFSVSRTQNMVNSLDPNKKNKSLQNLLTYVKKSCQTGSGLWMDYLEAYDNFPAGLKADDLCLLENGLTDNLAYDEHLTRSKEAQLLITNHATVLNHFALANTEFHALIVDEAHEVLSVCESMSNHRMQVQKIKRYVFDTGLKNKLTKQIDAAINGVLAEFDKIDTRYKSHVNVMTDMTYFNEIKALIEPIETLSELIFKLYQSYKKGIVLDSITQEQSSILNNLEEAYQNCQRFVKDDDKYRKRAISFSNVNRIASIASIDNFPGRLFNHRTKNCDKILFTSATLSDANNNLSFKSICGSLAIKYELLKPENMLRVAPHAYGQMTFVRTDRSIPKPIDEYKEEAEYNPIWINHTVKMINEAHKAGVTLVLVPSFKEAKKLGYYLKLDANPNADKVLVHEQGKSLQEILPAFKSREKTLLITPSAWEGITIRDNDSKQLIENLVITRIPYKPTDEEARQLAIEHRTDRSPTDVKGDMWRDTTQKAVTKLKQGLGRGIRSPDDVVKVWFADPRMPSKETMPVIRCISRRFLLNYINADVFGEETTQKPKFLF